MDAIHYKIREDDRYVSKAVYTILSIRLDVRKEVLGLYLSKNEGANFWLQVLTDLQNRRIEDILIASVYGLTGFPQAINSIFPNTEMQLCIAHQVRNSLKYVASKNQKKFMKDLKPVYKAASKKVAEDELDRLEEKWGGNVSYCYSVMEKQVVEPLLLFQVPCRDQKIIYTTNIIESVHRQFRKLTKTKGAFPNENSLIKLLYMGILNASKK